MWEDEDEDLRLPEPEDRKKEVWGTLGAVGSYANMAKNNCHVLYMRIPEWELKETSPLENKWRKYGIRSYV